MLNHTWDTSFTPSMVRGTAQKTRSMAEQKERKNWREKRWIIVLCCPSIKGTGNSCDYPQATNKFLFNSFLL